MSADAPDLDAVRRRILGEHRGTVAAVLAAADAVAATLEEGATTDAAAIAGPLSAALRERGLDERLVALLVDAVAATDRELPADPVAAPPYLAVTSRGPVCRATLPDGRLVVAVRAFRIERRARGGETGAPTAGHGTTGSRTQYVRTGVDPAAAVDVSFAAAESQD